MKRLTLVVFLIGTSILAQSTFVAEACIESDYLFQDSDENGNAIGEKMFLAGCSWYCGGGVSQIEASSYLAATKNNSYGPENAHDFEYKTAWVEGKEDEGIGESITYTFNFDANQDYKGTLGVTTLLVGNGYKKSEKTWKENGRVKRFHLYVNEELYGSIQLLDQIALQKVPIGTIMFPKDETLQLRFEIQEVYPGSKYKDTAISLLMFDGVGVH